MPLLNINISGKSDTTTTEKITSTLMNLTSTILKKDSNVTAITINYIDKENWIIGGKHLSLSNKDSFSLEIKITEDANTKAEKQCYIKAVFAAFSEIFNDIHEASYIHIQDIKAIAYGYGGYTQEYRYQKSLAA